MRIVLVWPNQQQLVAARYMKKIQAGLGSLPPIGLIGLATWLRDREHHQVTVVDACLAGLTCQETAAQIAAQQPQVVGISAMTHSWLDCLQLAQAVKSACPGVVVVLGGPHASIYPQESLQQGAIDYVVMGDGEIPFSALLTELAHGKVDTSQIEGVMAPGEAMKPRYTHRDLDQLPIADRRLTDYRAYSTVVSTRPPSTTIMSSRGCPYPCNFCYTAGSKQYRAVSAEHLLAEIKACLDLGIADFLFFDELFTLDRSRVMQFCKLVREQNLSFAWDVRARVDLVDEELLKTMAKAGCRRVQFGIESGSDDTLRRLNKKITIAQAEQAVTWCRQAGIATYGDFMIGAPGESEAQIRQTVSFAKKLRLDYSHFSVLMLYPETTFYRQALSEGVLAADVWREFVKNPTADFRVPYWNREFSREELESLLTWAMRQVYLSPDFLWRRLKACRSLGQFCRQMWAGITVLR